jgi:hypothetical protein
VGGNNDEPPLSAHQSRPTIRSPILWFTAFMHMFSYSSLPATPYVEFAFVGATSPASRSACLSRSWSSADPKLAKGRPIIITMRARSSEKFSPSDSFAPTTASRSAPFVWEESLRKGWDCQCCRDLHYFGFLLRTEIATRGRQLLTP